MKPFFFFFFGYYGKHTQFLQIAEFLNFVPKLLVYMIKICCAAN